MRKKRGEQLERIFEAYPRGVMQDVRNAVLAMIEHDISLQEFVDFTEWKMEVIAKQRRKMAGMSDELAELLEKNRIKKTPKCPECGETVLTFGVNTTKRNQVGGKWRTIIYCPDDRNCGWQEMSKKTPAQLVRDWGLYEVDGLKEFEEKVRNG